MKRRMSKAIGLMLVMALCIDLLIPALPVSANEEPDNDVTVQELDITEQVISESDITTEESANDSGSNADAEESAGEGSDDANADADSNADVADAVDPDAQEADPDETDASVKEDQTIELPGQDAETPEVSDAEEADEQDDAIEAEFESFEATTDRSLFLINGTELKKYYGTTEAHVVIPDDITTIGDNAFEKHNEIETVTFPSGLTSIGNHAFESCASLKYVDLSNTKITKIGEWAFRACTSLEVPGFPITLSLIDHGAFYGAALGSKEKLGELIIPAGVTTIRHEAFGRCSLLGSVEFKGYEGNAGEVQDPIEFKEYIGTGDIFTDCANLKKITLSNRIAYIPIGFASNCKALEEVVWTDTITEIKNKAFVECKALKSADLSNTKITKFGEWAFRGCSALDVPKFPETLVEIGRGSFDGAALGTNEKFGDLVIPASVETIRYEAFKNCSLLGTVEFKGYEDEKKPVIVFECTFGMNDAFMDCKNLRKITLSNKIDKLERGFASGCASLEEVVWTDTLTSIGSHAFYECKKLKNADLSKTKVTEIGEWAFRYCESLNAPKFPETMDQIGHGAFEGAALGTKSTLGEIYIPSDITEIKNEAFMGAKYLGKAVFGPDNGWDVHMKVGDNCFDGCENLQILVITSRMDIIPARFASSCKKLTNIKIENGVKEIKNYAFQIANARPKVTTTVEGNSDVVKNYDWSGDGRIRKEGTIEVDIEQPAPDGTEIPEETSFYVSFITYGGTVIPAVLAAKGDKIAMPEDPVKSGYIFAGWYKDADYTEAWSFTADTVDERTYLYAKWEMVDEIVTDTPAEEADPYIAYEDDKRIELSASNCTINPVKAKTYDGTSYKPSLTVKYTASGAGKPVTLTEGVDYIIRYENNVNAGEGKAYVVGCGKYKGETLNTTFKINKKPMSKLKVMADGVSLGSAKKPNIYVYDGNKMLLPGVDYKADWSGYKNDQKGTYKIPLKAEEKSNYSGDIKAKVTVYKAANILSAANTDVLIEGGSTYTAAFNAAKITPKVTVKYYGRKLGSKDYKVTYSNNVNAGTAYITVKGKKNYAGSVVKTFEITPVEKSFELNKSNIAVTYNGKLLKPKVTVKTSFTNAKGRQVSKKLKAGVDYTIVYRNNLHAGSNAEILIKGKGNYTAVSEKTVKFTIRPINLNKAKITGKKDDYKLFFKTRDLIEGKDYTFVKYGEEKSGKIEVILKGMGDFGAAPDAEIIKKISLN